MAARMCSARRRTQHARRVRSLFQPAALQPNPGLGRTSASLWGKSEKVKAKKAETERRPRDKERKETEGIG